jgi:hypothetical protein
MMETVRAEFYAISVERSVKHPAVAANVQGARHNFAAFESKRPSRAERPSRATS